MFWILFFIFIFFGSFRFEPLISVNSHDIVAQICAFLLLFITEVIELTPCPGSGPGPVCHSIHKSANRRRPMIDGSLGFFFSYIFGISTRLSNLRMNISTSYLPYNCKWEILEGAYCITQMIMSH